MAIIDITKILNKSGVTRKVNLYTFAGFGLVRYDSKQYWVKSDSVRIAGQQSTYRSSPKQRATPHEMKSYPSTDAVLPVGLGVRYSATKKIDLSLEFTLRGVNSDKLDAQIAGGAKDYYQWTALSVAYNIGKNDASKQWVSPLEAMYNDLQDVKGKIHGLTNDKDGDGVADTFDKDNSTPEGVKVYGDGTTVDTDGDGVADSMDEDNFTPRGAKVDEKGRAVDSDGDGVPDALDLEPNTEKGALVNFQGKTLAKPGEKIGSGSGGAVAVYFPSVYFETNVSTIGAGQYDKIAAIARALIANPSLKVRIVGHADKVGSEKFNQGLSDKRSKALVDHLVKNYNISADRLTSEGKGESEPLSPNILKVNRRVDVLVK